MRKWFLYVVECSDGTLYTGVTVDLDRRVTEHNTSNKGAKYTMTRRPVKLVWSREYPTRSEAQAAEYKLKKLPRRKKLKMINNG
tara:strand:+ start:5983 stop:6234 length:252 start_codon:yes stop_codon:yes gene_type:complete